MKIPLTSRGEYLWCSPKPQQTGAHWLAIGCNSNKDIYGKENYFTWQSLGGLAQRRGSQSHIDFPHSPESLHTVLWQELVRFLVGTTLIGWYAVKMLRLETYIRESESVCAILNSADWLYRSDPNPCWGIGSSMQQLKTHLSTVSPYGWMWSGGAPLITFMVLLGAQGAACIIISAQAALWNHKSAKHARAGLVSSWPHGTSHLFVWECLRAFSLGQWYSVNVPAWKISLSWDACKMIRPFQICHCVLIVLTEVK